MGAGIDQGEIVVNWSRYHQAPISMIGWYPIRTTRYDTHSAELIAVVIVQLIHYLKMTNLKRKTLKI